MSLNNRNLTDPEITNAERYGGGEPYATLSPSTYAGMMEGRYRQMAKQEREREEAAKHWPGQAAKHWPGPSFAPHEPEITMGAATAKAIRDDQKKES